jgi:hypothetical protein
MNSTLKIELNGALITGRIDGIDNFVINYRNDAQDGTVKKSYSSELTFYDDGYQILFTNLVNNPNGFNEKVSVKVYDDCCGKMVFDGFITGDAIDWCDPECSITANIVEEDQELSCIKNTLIWDNWNGFLNQGYNPIPYCVENRPQFIHGLLIAIGQFLGLVVTLVFGFLYGVVFLIWSIVYLICLIVALFPGGISTSDCTTPDMAATDSVLSVYDEIMGFLIPCDDFHVAPYVRQYIINACGKCGLNFKSSILNDQNGQVGKIYYNTVLLAAEVKRGRNSSSNNQTMIPDNLPVETLETLFRDYLNPLFNAQWQVIGNDFVFERKDYFNGIAQWIDADQLLADGKILENKICWNWIDRERYAYGRFEYQMDAMEYIGNEAKNRYNDLVDWNVPYSSAQTGEWNRTVPISPARVVADGIANSVFGGGNKGLLLLAQHTMFNYKIFVWNRSFGYIEFFYPDSFVQPFGGNIGVPVQERYNYPFWFVEGVQGVSGFQNNLYSLFHYIDNPRLPTATQFDFSFTFEFDCSQFNNFSFTNYVKLSRGSLNLNGQISEISVDFNRRTIQVKGTA